ncbi:MAG: aspartate/glutamate racemase family protein [Chloroflexi bacterium]|nr:aspartate/glutamate racemase family protein [Chloroflexota bacterium]
MKTIGLIGGMSWESSIEYYRIINEETKKRLGGLHSAKSVMVSVDFAEIETLQHEGRWDEAGRILARVAQDVERGGADLLVLCTNTMHKVADQMQTGMHIPLLHIADATAQRIQAAGLTRIGLLGTRFTMEQDFYKGRLIEKHGLEVLTPDEVEREIVHCVIYDELCLGLIQDESREAYKRIMAGLIERGAQGIILGCTEIELLVHAQDCAVPLFPTTRIHAEAAVEYALK